MEAFITEFRMRFSRALRPNESPKLRGYFGRSFESEELLHHHKKDGSLLYAYPRIQFKVIKNAAYLIGFGDGGELLSKLWLKIDKAKIGLSDMPVIESSIIKRKTELGESPNPVCYKFISPWLARSLSTKMSLFLKIVLLKFFSKHIQFTARGSRNRSGCQGSR